MTKVIFRSLVICVALTLSLPYIAISQTNPHTQYRDIIGSESHSSFIHSAATPKVISPPEFGSFSLVSQPIGEDRYLYNFQPELSEGKAKAVIEFYKQDQESGMLIPDYTTIHFRITKSLISCGDDRITIKVNSTVENIPVLDNDTRTDGPLSLLSILYQEGGFASIGNDGINFTPSLDFEGDAFVYYAVTDTVGKVGSGILKIKVIDPSSVDKDADISALSYGGEDIEIDLPYPDFALDSPITYGSFVKEGGAQIYRPHGNQNTVETFTVRSGNISRDITVKVIEKARNNSWVVDDVRYTAKGVPVYFNVINNDYKQNVMITNQSSQLKQEEAADGLFSYSPPSYFTGTKKFQYTAFNGFETETGQVFIHVNNFNPSTKVDYSFTTVANSALVVDYNVPISNYSFSLVGEPSHGRVNINNGSSSIDLGCEEISGRNLILYEPNYAYIGEDQFSVLYCVEGKCKTIDIKVNVVANDLTECACYTGCVWSGDANNDGIVNASDLLAMAYSFGSSGAPSDWNGSNTWLGRKTNDWLNQSQSGINAKFSDSDGNGIVDDVDFDAILDNYSENHALVPPQILDNKSFAFTIVPTSDTVYLGDVITFEIGIGNESYPALDVNGLVYNLGFPPSIVDSASVLLDYHNNSWFGIDEKVYGISKQIRDGWIETAVSRLGVKPKSGAGTLGTLNFIVEEDVVGGFRTSDDGIIPIPITISGAKVIAGDGKYYQLPDSEGVVYLNLNQQGQKVAEDLLTVYPNPAHNLINVNLSGEKNIESLQVFNITGQLIEDVKNISSDFVKINLTNYQQGVYILRALSSDGIHSAKFEVY